MDLEMIILSKSEWERQIPYDITIRSYLEIDTNEDIYTEKGKHRFIKKSMVSQIESDED